VEEPAPIEVRLPAAEGEKPGWRHLSVTFNLPDRNLGWAAILDLGDRGRHLLTHGVRTFAAEDPRQPKAPGEGAVDNAKIVTVYHDGWRITEAAIPWKEMSAVRQAIEARDTVRFSYRVNHRGGGPLLELADRRSVSRSSPFAFHLDWTEHWVHGASRISRVEC
jgi:hypothetical protein